MCGIAGILKLVPGESVDEARLKRMRDVIRHRGPDGEGLWLEGPVGLAHRRLAIVDPALGHQPMTNEDERLWIVYNGEVYNHASLRPGLEAAGHRYRTRSDTETVLHLYEEEGDRCVERLRGMFAFALWDGVRRRLLLARDPLGIKPLYYAITEHELLFASEIKAILAAGPIRPALETSVLPEFLANRYVAGPETLFRGIRKLLPGRTLSWSADSGFAERRYWRLPDALDASSSPLVARAGEVRARFVEAVRSHLMSDVPLGVFLSGGLDSSALVAVMARVSEGPVRSFSVGFEEREADELPFARLAARAARAEHREIVVSRQDFFDALPRLVWHEDEPIAFPSSIPLYFVARLAQPHVKVVLTGEGADELFLGYNRYRVTAWNARLGRVYGAIAPEMLRGAVRRSVPFLPGSIRRIAQRTVLGLRPGIRSLFFENFAVFPESLQRGMLRAPEWLDARDPYAAGLQAFAAAPGDVLDRLSHADIQTYMVELLMKQDQMSMAASVESRVPFLDQSLVEHVSAMPGRFKLRGWQTKAVFRSAVRDLVPREILSRRKMGFPVPIGRWFRGPQQAWVQELVAGSRARARGLFDPTALTRLIQDHATGRAEHGDRLWLLANLELWHRVFVDGEEPGALPEVA